MTIATSRMTEQKVPLAGTELFLLKGGTGAPLLFLHGEEGFEGELAVHGALAEGATVYAPSHPGFGHTEAPEWVTQVPHHAVFYLWFLQQAGLGPVDVVGTGIGGWIAAEMALMEPKALKHLLLVDAGGIKPKDSDIFDIFIVRWIEMLQRGFADHEQSAEYKRLYGEGIPEFGGTREAGRTMLLKMAFRPYMYDTALPGMLGRVTTPTLIVWGNQDRITPLECGRLYQQAIPNASLKVIDNCGHFAHLERPDELAAIVQDFVSK